MLPTLFNKGQNKGGEKKNPKLKEGICEIMQPEHELLGTFCQYEKLQC